LRPKIGVVFIHNPFCVDVKVERLCTGVNFILDLFLSLAPLRIYYFTNAISFLLFVKIIQIEMAVDNECVVIPQELHSDVKICPDGNIWLFNTFI
jgi:hypothetical protein